MGKIGQAPASTPATARSPWGKHGTRAERGTKHTDLVPLRTKNLCDRHRPRYQQHQKCLDLKLPQTIKSIILFLDVPVLVGFPSAQYVSWSGYRSTGLLVASQFTVWRQNKYILLQYLPDELPNTSCQDTWIHMVVS